MWAIGASVAAAQATDWCDLPAASLKITPALVTSLDQARENAPAARTELHTEGTLPTDPAYQPPREARKDLQRMQNVAMSWRINRDPEALSLAKHYLNTWVRTYRPSFNPIDETDFGAMIGTYAIIRPELSATDDAFIRAYLHAWAQGYIDRIDAAGAAARSTTHTTWSNNWQSHRIKLVTTMAVALDDAALFDDARRLFRRQVATNINGSTGEVLDFRRRDAIHYVVFDLLPLIQAATAAQLRGEDWYHWTAPDDASVALGMEWLRPYATGAKTHEEFVHSGVAFDAKRRAANMTGFSGMFDPRRSANIYWYAARFDPSFKPIAAALKPYAPMDVRFCGR